MRKGIMFLAVLLILSACSRSQPQVIVITATFPSAPLPGVTSEVIQQNPGFVPMPTASLPPLNLSPVPEVVAFAPTPDPTRPVTDASVARQYVVQPGDTLTGIAAAYGVSMSELLSFNQLVDPNVLEVGQIIILPEPPEQQTSAFKILPDGRLVRGPGSAQFDVLAYVAQMPGYIRTAFDTMDDELVSAGEIVRRVSLYFSVDARVLLALLEFRAGWLSNPAPREDLRQYPLGVAEYPPGTERTGLYRQLSWAANELNRGYYGWKIGSLTTVEFGEGLRFLYAPTLNAGTVAVQRFFSLTDDLNAWMQNVGQNGFYRTYYAYFGDPFAGAFEPLVPFDLQQPLLTLPFPSGQTWFYTGGPHGGWGAGSAWAAIDFAPPDEPRGACYVSDNYATAVAPGVIARSDDGAVLLDLDGDGDESTGWTILYLHMAREGRVAQGTLVQTGDPIGRPSCEGGFSNATHMHIARRYNGEWIPAYCNDCNPSNPRPQFVMSGWAVVGFANQEYQGYMTRNGERRDALQGRLSTDNNVSW
ncbi:MAG: LysM peptidoglycan-binding domain-containing protein [Chloroflexi bacterium]|nr:LysM peptidoglycan-binding domain-containing protein [Chloroflexota bacterium]